jgi:hypothetical protein
VPVISTAAAAALGGVDECWVREDFALFERLVAIAEEFHAASHLRAATACAEIAATCAWRNHPGLFASTRLERLIADLADAAADHAAADHADHRPARANFPGHVLHVMSKARRMGGDSRFVCRWIQSDPGRRHSIAVTTQLDEPIPDVFVEAASRAGGAVHRLDEGTRDPIVRARRLRALARTADFAVLHLYPDDIVPVLAFAGASPRPPTAFIHHSDHTFWLGVGISDLVVQLRGCSVELSVGRRHVERERLVTLPIPLMHAERKLSRADAKAKLGLAPDTVVLLSVGTGFKYARVGGPGFLDVLWPVMARHDNAVLMVVGPRSTGDWAVAEEATGGRIVPMGPRYDTASLFEAADVYLDSFPFTSPTAALEAGTYGLPLIAFCPRRGDARVLCPGAPGLDETMWRETEVGAYQRAVERFIADVDLRAQYGERARRTIEDHHMGSEWAAHLAGVYRAAATVSRATVPNQPDRCSVEEVDLVINGLYRSDSDGVGGFIDRYVRPLPFTARVAVLRRLLDVNRSFSFQMFIPGRVPAWRPPGWKTVRRLIPV